MDYIKNTTLPSPSKVVIENGIPYFSFIDVNIEELKKVIIAFENEDFDSIPDTNYLFLCMKKFGITSDKKTIENFLETCVKHINGVAELKKMTSDVMERMTKGSVSDEDCFVYEIRRSNDFLRKIYLYQQQAHHYLTSAKITKDLVSKCRYMSIALEILTKRSQRLSPLMVQFSKSMGVVTHDINLEKEMLELNPELSRFFFTD